MGRTAVVLEQNWNAVPGGTARSVNRLVCALLEHTNTELIGVHGAHRSEPVLALPEGLDLAQVPVPGRALAESWSRFDRLSIDRWVDVDVVHCPAYVMAKTRAARVATIHDLAFVRHPEWFTPNGVRYFTRFLDRVRESDTVIIVPSQTTADDCVRRGIDESRIHVIGWGIDVVPATDDEIANVVERYSLPESFVLFVGTVEPRKNVGVLLEAMEAIPNTPLVIVGPAGWGDVPVGDAMVLGHVPDVDIGPLMAAASVLAYPSHFEGFGLPVLEAMAQETPVLVTQHTAPAELVGDTGLVIDTRKATVVADALRELLDAPDERARLGALAVKRVDRFRWDESARAHAAVYEELS